MYVCMYVLYYCDHVCSLLLRFKQLEYKLESFYTHCAKLDSAIVLHFDGLWRGSITRPTKMGEQLTAL